MPSDTTLTVATSRVRPRWSSLGGGALLAGALALLVATIVEYFVWQNGMLAAPGLFVVFSVFFLANVLLYLVSTFALAFADGGIVGRSVIGRTGFVMFGVGWASAELIYWAWYLVDVLPSTVDVLGTIALAVTYAGAIAAAVIVALGRVVEGHARWALIVGLAVGAICSSFAKDGPDQVLTTVLLSISCVAQAFIGLSYLGARRRSASV